MYLRNSEQTKSFLIKKNDKMQCQTGKIWREISVKITDFSHRWIIWVIAKFDFSDG